MKSAISTVLVSLLITVIISIGFGFALSNFLGFLQGTTLVFLLQIILFYVYSLIRQNNINFAPFFRQKQVIFEFFENEVKIQKI